MMDFFSIWPSFVSTLVLIGFASSRVMKVADMPVGSRISRVDNLDGLRGFLAISVLFHHAAIYHGFILDGRWIPPPSQFYSLLGPAGVSMFFMMTGYLFWARLLKDRGRPAWLPLFVGRVFRIGPLYVVAAAIVVLIVSFQSEFSVRVGYLELLQQLCFWLTLGFNTVPDVNGYRGTGLLLAGVTWSIHYEWIFYLSLPLIALAARSNRAHLPIVTCCLVVALLREVLYPVPLGRVVLTSLFLTGMICASLQKAGFTLKMTDTRSSCCVVISIVCSFLFGGLYTAYSVLLLGFAFFMISSGCTVFGLLQTVPARRLGNVSYGIYLLQGLVLAALLRPESLRVRALASPAYHWALVLLSAVLLVAVATVAHILVERPGIALGKRAANGLKRGLDRLSARPAPSLSAAPE